MHDLLTFGCSKCTDVSRVERTDLSFLFMKTNSHLETLQAGKKNPEGKKFFLNEVQLSLII